MPTRPEGVYQDSRGAWHFKVKVGRDPLTGRREQITRRGFRTASEAGRSRRDVLAQKDSGRIKPAPKLLTVGELLDLYLDGINADGSLGAKTRYDYRHNAEAYLRPWLGDRKVRDVTPEVILTWQRKLTKGGGTKKGKALAPNTIRLARAPLAGAFKLAVSSGIVAVSPVDLVQRPKARRSIPKHWSPGEARHFLALMEGDRTWPVWAFLLGSGLRIGEVVWLRWSNVDLVGGLARVVEFATTLGYDVVASDGKSRDSVRTIDLDDGVMRALKKQRKLQAAERLSSTTYEAKRLCLHQARGRLLPPAVPIADAGPVHQRVGPASAHGARLEAHVRHAHARQRRAGEGRGRAAGPRRPDNVHEPV